MTPRSNIFVGLFVGLLVCLFAGASPARADSTDPAVIKARTLFESGRAHYNLGEFKEALEDFKAAYRHKQDPILLFNVAQAQRQLGDHEAAARSYRGYLRDLPTATNRTEVERLIVQEEHAVEAARAAAPPYAVQSPQDHSAPPSMNAATSTNPAPVTTPPIGAAAPADSNATSVAVSGTTEAAATGKPRSRTWLWVTLGVGGGVLIAGAAVGLAVGLSPSAPTNDLGVYAPAFH